MRLKGRKKPGGKHRGPKGFVLPFLSPVPFVLLIPSPVEKKRIVCYSFAHENCMFPLPFYSGGFVTFLPDIMFKNYGLWSSAMVGAGKRPF